MFIRLYPAFFLLANGLVYFVLAWLFLSNPAQWFTNLGIELMNTAGLTELRATYVGLFVGLGLYFGICGMRASWRGAGMLLALVSYAGLAVARAYGLYVVGEGNGLMGQLLLSEALLVFLSLLGFYCLGRQPRQRKNPYL